MVTLNQDAFRVLLDIVGVLKNSCSHLSIQNGTIKILSDSRQIIFDIDAGSILGDLTLAMVNISDKLKLLEIFNKKKNENFSVDIDAKDENNIFSNKELTIKIVKPPELLINSINRILTDEIIQSRVSSDVVVISLDVSEEMHKTMSKLSSTLKTKNMELYSNRDKNIVGFSINMMDANSPISADVLSAQNLTDNDILRKFDKVVFDATPIFELDPPYTIRVSYKNRDEENLPSLLVVSLLKDVSLQNSDSPIKIKIHIVNVLRKDSK